MLQPVKLLQVSFDRIIEIVENSRARYDCLALFGGQGMEVRRARLEDVTGIIKVCSDGWRETYQDLVPQSYIEQVVADYYNEERVTREYAEDTPYYHGYWVAEKDDEVLGCIGGGIDEQNAGHVYVFYVHLDVKRQGIGTALLEAFTAYQKRAYGITEQWITSLMEGNRIGEAFYEKNGFIFEFATENPDAPHSHRSLHLKRNV